MHDQYRVHMYAVDSDDEKIKDRHVLLHVNLATSLGPACDPDVLTRNARRAYGGGGGVPPIYPNAPAYARRARAARRRTGRQCWTTRRAR